MPNEMQLADHSGVLSFNILSMTSNYLRDIFVNYECSSGCHHHTGGVGISHPLKLVTWDAVAFTKVLL